MNYNFRLLCPNRVYAIYPGRPAREPQAHAERPAVGRAAGITKRKTARASSISNSNTRSGQNGSGHAVNNWVNWTRFVPLTHRFELAPAMRGIGLFSEGTNSAGANGS